MTIEEEIFQKSIILDDKLREYGFQKQGEVYLYVKNIEKACKIIKNS